MTELLGYAFRFADPTSGVLDAFLKQLPPSDQETILREVEPVLADRDRQLEDAITRILSCTCGGEA